MDKLQAMQVFTHVVDANSFSGAADALHMTRSSVSTIIQNLEAMLKVRLLNRTTRRISLTPDGAAYYERCTRILAEIEEAENVYADVARAPRGKLKVDMPGSIGRMVIVPVLDDFHARYPDVDLMLGTSDKPVDLVAESVDCAIRIGALQDSTLVARRVGTSGLVTVGSPSYLAQHGAPAALADLEQHVAVNYFSNRNGRRAGMDFVVDGRPVEIKVPSKLAANDGDTYLQCGIEGHGLIQVPHFMALAYVRKGELVEVLQRWRPASLPIWVVYPQNRHLSAHVRVFVDWVAEVFEKCWMLRRDDVPALALAPSFPSAPNVAQTVRAQAANEAPGESGQRERTARPVARA